MPGLAAEASGSEPGVVSLWRLIRTAMGDRRYIGIAMLLFITAVAISLAAPMVAVFGSGDLHLPPEHIAGYFSITAAVGLGALIITGRLSDRRAGSRRGIILFALAWLSIGYFAFSKVNTFGQLLLVGVVFFGLLTVPSAQVFALARQVTLSLGQGRSTASMTSLLRTIYSLGWVSGAAVGGVLYVHLGPRNLFQLIAILELSAVLLAWRILPRTVSGTLDEELRPASRRTRQLLRPKFDVIRSMRTPILLVLIVALVLLSSGNGMRLGMVPLLLLETMHAQPVTIGLALSITPLLEVPLIPLFGLYASRYGPRPVVLMGATAATVSYGLLTNATGTFQVIVAQGVYAIFVAAVVGAGIDYVQTLAGQQSGLGTSLFFAHEAIAMLIGGLLTPVAVAVAGVQKGFILPTCLCAVGCVILFILVALTKSSTVRFPQRP